MKGLKLLFLEIVISLCLHSFKCSGGGTLHVYKVNEANKELIRKTFWSILLLCIRFDYSLKKKSKVILEFVLLSQTVRESKQLILMQKKGTTLKNEKKSSR